PPFRLSKRWLASTPPISLVPTCGRYASTRCKTIGYGVRQGMAIALVRCADDAGRALPRDPAGGGGNNENRTGCDRIDDRFGGRSIAPFRAGGSIDDGARPIDGECGDDPDDRRPEDGAPWPWRIWRGERAVHGGWFGGGDRRGDGGW